MLIQELKLPKDIEIKFYRLTQPLFNNYTNIYTNNLSLSGIYQKEIPNENITLNKLNEENTSNYFSLSSSFGKVFLSEKLEGLIIFSNNSENFVTIKDLEIKVIIDPLKDKKKIEKNLNQIKLPSNGIQIKPKMAYSIKLELYLDLTGKYTLDINHRVKSIAYNTLYNTLKLKGKIRDSPNEFRIIDNNNIEGLNNKKLTFDVNYPFKINESFHNFQLNEYFIDIRIKNNTIYPLTIHELVLTKKSINVSTKNEKDNKNTKISFLLNDNNNKDNNITGDKIYPLESLKDINNNEFIPLDKNIINFNEINTKYITLESEEEINLLFKININSDNNCNFNDYNFILEIYWLNLFDLNKKKFFYEFNNKLNIYNKYYKISVIEKPKNDIIYKNKNFKIKFKLESKNPNKKYVITIRQDVMKDDDRSTDREIEIIDIIEKKIELNSKKLSDNFLLICKSDILGNVYLPRLKFLVLEDGGITQNGNTYDTMLFFNCIECDNNDNNNIID